MNSGKSIQITVSYAVFILSGFLILSPIHKSENLPITLLTSAATSAILTTALIFIFSSGRFFSKTHTALNAFLSVAATLLSLFATLMLLTEIIKDIAYIANRGVSLFYYSFTALALLFVSYRLCTSSIKGIYRFCLLAFIPFIFLFIIMFFALLTTKQVEFGFNRDEGTLLPSVVTGIKAGVLFSADNIVFFSSFKEQFWSKGSSFPKKHLFSGYLLSYVFIIIYNFFTSLIFGSLTGKIQDPDYALIKLVRGIDLTEIISAVRIVSFLIKSSLYIFLSSFYLEKSLTAAKPAVRLITPILYSLLPATFLFLAIFNKSLEYGAFQHMIYPVSLLMSICFMLSYIFQKNS